MSKPEVPANVLHFYIVEVHPSAIDAGGKAVVVRLPLHHAKPFGGYELTFSSPREVYEFCHVGSIARSTTAASEWVEHNIPGYTL